MVEDTVDSLLVLEEPAVGSSLVEEYSTVILCVVDSGEVGERVTVASAVDPPLTEDPVASVSEVGSSVDEMLSVVFVG